MVPFQEFNQCQLNKEPGQEAQAKRFFYFDHVIKIDGQSTVFCWVTSQQSLHCSGFQKLLTNLWRQFWSCDQKRWAKKKNLNLEFQNSPTSWPGSLFNWHWFNWSLKYKGFLYQSDGPVKILVKLPYRVLDYFSISCCFCKLLLFFMYFLRIQSTNSAPLRTFFLRKLQSRRFKKWLYLKVK